MAGDKKFNVKKRKAAIVFVFVTVVIDIFGTFLVIPIMANFAREIQGEPASCLRPDGTSMRWLCLKGGRSDFCVSE